jgi:hypothetical protein
MDDRIEAFMVNVLALKGEDASAIHEGVCGPPTSCAQLFAAAEVNRRMKDKAAHACRSLCHARLVEKMRLRQATPRAEQLKLVLSVIGGPHLGKATNSARQYG